MSPKTPGQLAYEASLDSSASASTWDALTAEEQAQWESTADLGIPQPPPDPPPTPK